MGLENGSPHKAITIKDSGNKIDSMAKVYLSIVSAHIKVNLKIFLSMETGNKLLPMGTNMWANINRGNLKDMADMNGTKEGITKASSSMGKDKDMVYGMIQKEQNTRVSSNKTANMAKEDKYTNQGKDSKVTSKKV